ncbi:Wadjet anti-phage system protein JetA family protein [Stenotrophobium rhamnosiphilum]|uniref:Wadjet anti-phage system protein JetA family protein n=1 Tax=Stenotrophobium rhamnosiphilum TaxID=2029166 RepID=UPI0011B23F00|nr:Wadjet anti-phage system protein JetA family protein [Stenotrophobium rhamnosiphilum]
MSKPFFDRFPGDPDLLRPLVGPNRRRAWDLLLKLHDDYFGPDAPPPPDEGFKRRNIVVAIENFLLNSSAWVADDDDHPAENTYQQASVLLSRLLRTGWLIEKRTGVRYFIEMNEPVSAFLEHLKQFAEEGPQYIGADVLMIHNTMNQVEANPVAQASAFSRAALDARRVISKLKTTRVKVRDLMASLANEAETHAFVKGFFQDYVTGIFIADYRELRTKNHPLRGRDDILRIVSDLRDDPEKRELLREGYASFMRNTDKHSIEEAMDRDFERFRRFEEVESHLDRLDHSITRAVRQGTSFISYNLRTRGRLEKLLEQAAQVIPQAVAPGEKVTTAWAPGWLFNEADLRQPRVPAPPRPRAVISKREPTPTERALWELHRTMVRNREVSKRQIEEFLSNQMKDRSQLSSDEFHLTSVNDLVVYGALVRSAVASTHNRKGHPFTASIPGLKITLVKGDFTDNEYFKSPRFTVEWGKH